MTLHVDQYRGVAYMDGASDRFLRRLDDVAAMHFVVNHPLGHDNGYVITTSPHEDGECARHDPGPIVEVMVDQGGQEVQGGD